MVINGNFRHFPLIPTPFFPLFFFLPSLTGFGCDLTKRLSEYGAKIYAVSIECMDELEKTHKNVIPVRVDLRDWAGTKKALADALGSEQIDGIVNNAGVGALKSIWELTEDDYQL